MNDIIMAIVILGVVQICVMVHRRIKWWRKPWTKYDYRR